MWRYSEYNGLKFISYRKYKDMPYTDILLFIGGKDNG